jgi:hypothetical protein
MVLGSGRLLLRTAVFAALLTATLASSEARAQSAIGFTGGASIDPEQAYVGVFYQTPDIGGRFRLRGGLDGGFGQDIRLGTVNIDFVYLLPLGPGPWKFLTGGGPTIVLLHSADDTHDTGTELTAGGSWLLGFAHDSGFFAEFRIGGGNVPSLKMGVGWALKLK